MNRIEQSIAQSIALKQALLADEAFLLRIQQAADLMVSAFRRGGRVLFCGNGGSAADAQHLAAELSGRFYYDRPPLDAEALHVNSSYLTAVGNDYGYDAVYSRLLQASGHEGDVLVGISTSGNSRNVVKAMQVAREKGLRTIALTGQGGGQMAALSDVLLAVPSTDTPRIQECHILIGHIICELVEREMFPREGVSGGASGEPGVN